MYFSIDMKKGLVAIAVCMLLTISPILWGVETTDEPETDTGVTTTPPVTENTFEDDLALIEENEEDDEQIGFREDKVFLDFKEADIRDVLRVFARKAQINIVPSQKVQGTVTVKLTNIHWERALQLILEQHDFVLQKEEDGVYKVFTRDEVGVVPLETRVFTLSYIKADDAKKILSSLLTSERGKIEADPTGNNIIVSDVPGKLDSIGNVIQKLDTRIRQVSIEVQVLEKTRGNEKDIGIKWDFLKSYDITLSDIGRQWESLEVEEEKYWSYKRTNTTQELEPRLQDRDATQVTTNMIGDPEFTTPNRNFKTARTRTAILSADDMTVTLSALMSDANTQLLSNPKIATVDNRKAEVKVTRRIPIPQYSYNDQTGTYEIKSFSFEDVGIILEVTPQINQDDYITLEVKPSVTTQFGDKTFVISGGSIDIPIIDERSAETRVIVKSTETLVIAGLVSTEERKTMKKVPILGDIPIIRNAFRHTSTAQYNKDLLFFITPTLIEGDSGADVSLNPSATIVETVARTSAEPVQ